MAGEDSTQQVNLVALAAKIVGDAGTNVTLSVARVQEAPPPPPSPGRSAAPALPEERFNVTLTRAVAPLGPVLSTPDALPSPRGDGLPPKTPPRHADAARAGGAQPRRPHEFSVGEIGKQLRTMQLSPERKGEGEAGEGAGDGAPPADAASGEGGAPDGAPAAAREDAEAGSGAARLLAAAADGDVARIKRLVAGGVTVGSRDEAWFSDTPLHFAALVLPPSPPALQPLRFRMMNLPSCPRALTPWGSPLAARRLWRARLNAWLADERAADLFSYNYF